MTREEEERLERTRFTLLSAARASGALLMLLGLWIWHGDVIREGGYLLVGAPLFVAGFVESLILPQVLARKWRSPPRP
jgi:hypothetical protein